MKGSISRQIMAIISLMVAIAFVVTFVLNALLLPHYYAWQKQRSMVDNYNLICNTAASEEDLDTEQIQNAIDAAAFENNISTLVVTSDQKLLVSSSGEFRAMQSDIVDMILNPPTNDIISDNENYAIFYRSDQHSDANYMTLLAKLDNGDIVMMRTTVEGIRESARVSNQFLLICGVIMLIVSVLLGGLLSLYVIRPIRSLTEISKQMVDLNFEAKYTSGSCRFGSLPSLRELFHLGKFRKTDHSGQNEVDQLGEHINQLSETLEATISELKAANLELTKDIEQKEQIDEMRKEFLSNVTHELKTPLAIIQGYAEGLQVGINDDDPESREFYCDVIVDEAGKMNRMVKKLLTLNQLEFGKSQVTMERFDITELIRGVAHSSQVLMDQKGITLAELPESSEYVWADEFKLEEVVTNFLSNAINHADGPKEISIYYTEHDDLLRVHVFNTGAYIPEEDIDKIWEKFYKVDKARTREYGGSGIGLSIVKAIMDSFGQKCGVLNRDNGVEFWLELEKR